MLMTKGHHKSKSGIFRQYLFMVSAAACAMYAIIGCGQVFSWGEVPSLVELWLLVMSTLLMALANAQNVRLSDSIEKAKEIFVAILFGMIALCWMFWADQMLTLSSAQPVLLFGITAPVIYVLIFANRRNNTKLPAIYPLLNAVIFTLIAYKTLVSNVSSTGVLCWFNFLAIVLVYIAIPLCLDGWLAKSKKVN